MHFNRTIPLHLSNFENVIRIQPYWQQSALRPTFSLVMNSTSHSPPLYHICIFMKNQHKMSWWGLGPTPTEKLVVIEG